LLNHAQDLVEKTAAKGRGKSALPILWKYTDPDSGSDFYLTEKKVTVKSPYSGKSFSTKPEKFTMGDVSKELKGDAKAEKAAK
jgi:hypothetical protein